MHPALLEVYKALLVLPAILLALPYAVLSWLYRQVFCARIPAADRTVVITGCDTGFGNLLARLLDQKGATVIATCLTETGADALRKTASPRLVTVIVDVTRDADVARLAALVKERAPNGLWGLVNNAGIVGDSFFEFVSVEDYQRVMDVNFFGAVRVTHALVPLIRKSRGRIVNVTSMAGRLGMPGISLYCASKHAGEGWTDALRRELQNFGVKVSLIEPSFMRTPIVSNGIDGLERRWNAAPDALRKEYGGDEQVARLRREAATMQKWACEDPQYVVRSMEHALLSPWPHRRYYPGFGSKVAAILSILPAVLMDELVRVS